MPPGPIPFKDPMASVGIGHKLEYLVVLDQSIQQHLRILVMDIVITSAMYV